MGKLDKKQIAGLTVCAVLVIAIIFFAIDAGRGLKKGKSAETAVQTQQPKEKKEDKNVKVKITSTMIRESLGDMGTLVTADYAFTQVETYQKTKKLFSVIDVNSSFVYSYDGVVYAGVDFKNVKVEKNDINKEVIIEVPKATITSVEIDYNSFKTYSEKEGFLNPLSITDYNAAQTEFDKKARTLAEEKGILNKADENAKTIIESFVSSLMEEEEGYSIVFKER